MTGHVHAHQALVSVIMRLPGHPDLALEFVVDTGFSGFLTLPPAAVSALGLPYSHQIRINLADDSTARVNIHTAVVLWDGQERQVEVLATGRRPLLGTLLLDGHELNIQYADGGIVSIEPL